MIRATSLRLALVFALVGCGSSSLDVELIPPRFRVREVAGQLRPMRNQQRVPMGLLVDVFNDSSEPIVLKRLVVQSSPVSLSGIKFEPVTREFTETIPARSVRTVDLWITAWVELPNLDSGTSMTIRGVAYFETPYGGFRRVFNVSVVAQHTTAVGESG